MSDAGLASAAASTETTQPVIHTRHVVAATMGNALEFYDFTTYSFFAIQIGHVLFPSRSAYVTLMLSLATFGIGFIFRPLGALVIGWYSDRRGRKPAMLLSFALMGGSILVLALIPPYAAIGIAAPLLAVAARMVQGFALGGEVGSTTTFLFEASPPARRGLFSSFQGLSQSIASFFGGSIGAILSLVMTDASLEAYGWRIAFLIGGLTLPFGLILRRTLPETLHLSDHAPAYRELEPGKSVFRTHGRIIVLGLLLFMSGTVATYTFNYVTTFAHGILHMNTTVSFVATTVIQTCAVAAGFTAAWLSDFHGRRIVMIVPRALFLLAIYPVFYLVVQDRSAQALLIGFAVLSLFSSASQAAFYVSLNESLPKPIRSGGFGIIYALSISVFGGTTQLVITWLIHITNNPMAAAWYLLAATAIGLVAMILMAETAPARIRAAAQAIT
jgi:MFS family permease